MDLRHLRSFVAVAEERHFGRAAERLRMAQPPLSQHIKQLEAHLGVVLLERSTRRVELTPAGQRFLERARAILTDVDDATREVARVAAGEIGRVGIGFIGTATYAVLPDLSRLIRQRLPDVTVDLKGELLTPDLVAALHDRSLDLAFVRPPVGDPRLSVRILRRERLVAVLPSAHRLAGAAQVNLSALREEQFIGYPSRHRSVMHETLLAACRRAGFRPAQIHEVAETSTLVVSVAAGLGVALVPESVRQLQVTGATFVPLAGEPEEVELGVATRAGDESPTVRRILELLPEVT